MRKQIYATDGKYCLIPLNVDDRENYLNLRKQVTDTPQLYSTPEKADMMWNIMTEDEDINYSIYDSAGEYCGNIMLQNPQSDTPEIGVDLLESKRNQGIATRVIKLLAKQAYQELNVEYFLLRVSSRNKHSLHIVKKLGAILIGEEESEFNRIMKSLQESLGTNMFEKVLEQVPDFQIKSEEEEEEIIFRYQLTPNMFK